MTDYGQLYAISTAGSIMVLIRCLPVLLPIEIVDRHATALLWGCRITVSVAFVVSLMAVMALDSPGLLSCIVFAAAGFVAFAIRRSLAFAIVAGATAYALLLLIVP